MKTYDEYIKENIKENINWNYQLMILSGRGDLEGVKKAIKNGANVHVDGDSSLRWASSGGHLAVVKYLVENGANIHALNDESLQIAGENGHLNVVKYLIENGANINYQVLYWTSRKGPLEIVRYLISIYIERNKYKELLNNFHILPEKIKEELKLKIPHIFAAKDHGLI